MFPAIKNSNIQMFFRKNYFGSLPFLINLSAIAAVCYFSVFNLIWADPANIYLFKLNNRTKTLKKCVKYVQSLQ